MVYVDYLVTISSCISSIKTVRVKYQSHRDFVVLKVIYI